MLYTQYKGVVTGQDLIDSSLKKSGDERLDNIEIILADWTEVERTEISPTDVTELIAYLKAISRICPKAKSGSIVRRNNAGMGLTAWYRHVGDSLPWQIDIFSSLDEAFSFYGLEPKDIKL